MMKSDSISFKTEKIRAFCCELLQAYSVYEVDAEATTQRLLDAFCLGHEKLGLDRISTILKSLDSGDIDPRGMPCLLHETPAIKFMTGNQSLAEVSCSKAVDSIILKARQMGISLCVIKNSQSLGAPGVYSHLLAEQQCIGFCVTSSSHAPHIKLPGQSDLLLKSHPVSWSFPAATIQEATTIEFFTANNSDLIGDPQLLPVEGLGGIMLSVVKGMITSVLAGRSFPATKTQGTHLEQSEHLLMAIDPSHFGGMQKWNTEICQLQQSLANSTMETMMLKKISLPETISIQEQTWREVIPFAEKRKIALPDQVAT